METSVILEMLKNNRTLWVAAFVTGCFAVLVSILNSIWSFLQRRKQHDYEKRIEDHKSDLGKELECFKFDLRKEIENFKSDLDKKKYVSKVRFDTEFDLFRNIWRSCRKMVNDVYFVYPTYANVPVNDEAKKQYEQKVYEAAHSSYNIFLEVLENNAPFINDSIYKKLKEIGKLCRENLNLYEMKWNKGMLFTWEDSQEKREAEWKAYQRTDNFNQKYIELIEELRNYLNTLDVGAQGMILNNDH